MLSNSPTLPAYTGHVNSTQVTADDAGTSQDTMLVDQLNNKQASPAAATFCRNFTSRFTNDGLITLSTEARNYIKYLLGIEAHFRPSLNSNNEESHFLHYPAPANLFFDNIYKHYQKSGYPLPDNSQEQGKLKILYSIALLVLEIAFLRGNSLSLYPDNIPIQAAINSLPTSASIKRVTPLMIDTLSKTLSLLDKDLDHIHNLMLIESLRALQPQLVQSALKLSPESGLIETFMCLANFFYQSDLRGKQNLVLENRGFTRVPPLLAELPSLKSLSLKGNFITSLPDTIFSLSYLESLDVSNNNPVLTPGVFPKPITVKRFG